MQPVMHFWGILGTYLQTPTNRILRSGRWSMRIPAEPELDHKMQEKIAQSLALCGPVKSGADVWNMKKYSELKESVKTQVMYESLNKLGFG